MIRATDLLRRRKTARTAGAAESRDRELFRAARIAVSSASSIGPLRHRRINVEFYFALDARQRSQMSRQHNANHGSVCASTESTAGKIAHDRLPGIAAVSRAIDLSAGRAKINAARIERIDRTSHRAARSRSNRFCGRPFVSASHSLPPVRLR